jgi:hypothetical protein
MRLLLERSVFRVGLKLQCERCAQRNWYALDDLSERLRCERCLQTFPFPASSPTDAKWEYRPIGPFATENFAQGAYAAILAIHFLLREYSSAALWCPGFEIKRTGTKTIECDFGIFAPEKLVGDELVFAAGEAKCGDRRFSQKDYATCSTFSEAFPSAAFIFATTRSSIDPEEQRSIRALIRRRRVHLGQPAGHIVVLTRSELEAQHAPVESWSEEVVKEYRDDYDSTEMHRLARATQRLYL